MLWSLPVDEDELNSSTEKEGVEIFFFPDESNIKRQIIDATDLEESKSIEYEENVMETSQESKPMNVQVAKDLGDPSTPKSTPKKAKRKKVWFEYFNKLYLTCFVCLYGSNLARLLWRSS